MGSQASKSAGTDSDSIEKYYAALAADSSSSDARIARNGGLNEGDIPRSGHGTSSRRSGRHDDRPAEQTGGRHERDYDQSEPRAANDGASQADGLYNLRAVGALRNVGIPCGALESAAIHLTIAIRAVKTNAQDALEVALESLRRIDVIAVAKAILNWIKEHPWETAAIVIPLVLLACTPCFLGLAGFTASGIAAGSLAAGIQAGIGSVAAGSLFATLTSAAMAGYGAPIILGGVWGITSTVCWGVAAWKRYKSGKGDDDGDGVDDDKTA